MIRKFTFLLGLFILGYGQAFAQSTEAGHVFGVAQKISKESSKYQESPLSIALKEAIAENPIQKTYHLFEVNTLFRLPDSPNRQQVNEDLVQYLQINKKVYKELEAKNEKTLTLSITLKSGEELLLDLYKKNPFAEGALVKTSEGDEFPMPAHLHYRGVVRGHQGSVAGLTITENEVIGVFATRQHGQFNIARLDDYPDIHAVYSDAIYPEDINVGCQDAVEVPDAEKMQEEEFFSGERNHSNKCVDVYIETNRNLFTNKGSVNNVIAYVNGLFNNVAILYQNEEINVQISEIFVWTTPDGYSTNVGTALTQFRQARQGFNGNIAHLFLLGSGGGGVAYLNVVCTPSWAFAVSGIGASYNNFPNYSWTIMVVTHEIGHNLGSNHTQWCGWPGGAIDNCYPTEGNCPSGPPPVGGGTIMSYCHLTSSGINFLNGFGPLPGNRIRTRVGQVGCLAVGCGDPCLAFQPTASATATTCGLPNGTISVTISGGQAPFQVNIGNGFTTQTFFDNLEAGIYQVTIIDSENCEVELDVEVPESIPLDLDLAVTHTTCNLDNGVVEATVLSANGGVQFSIGFGFSPNDVFPDLAAGTYTLNAIDGNGCTFEELVEIEESQEIFVSAAIGNTTCGLDNGTIFFNISGGSGLGIYSIDFQNGLNYSTEVFYENLPAGNYTAHVIDDAGCEAFYDFVIEASEALDVSVQTSSSTCGLENGTANFQISGGSGSIYFVDFSATNGPVQQTAFTGLASGNYTATITDNIGCEALIDFEVGPSQGVELSVNTVSPSCGLSNGSLSVSMNLPHSFYTLNGVQSTSGIFANLSAGIYTVSGVASNGCDASIQVEITQENAVSATIETEQAFCGESGSATISIVEAGNYQFNIGQGTQPNGSFSNLQAGSYAVTVTDASGECLAVYSFVIEGSEAIEIEVSSTSTSCGASNGSFELLITGGSGNYNIVYENDQLSGLSGSGLSAGSYAVSVNDDQGCQTSTSVLIGSSEAVNATVQTQGTTCGQANGQAIIEVNSGLAPYSFNLGSGAQSQGLFENLSAGDYQITVTDAAGCSAVLTAAISSSEGIAVTSEIQAATCQQDNGSITLTSTGGTAPYTYQVNGIDIEGNTVENLSPGTYQIVVSDNGNCSTSMQVTVSNEGTAPQVDFAVVRGGLHVQMVNNSSGTNNNYLWNFGDGNTSTEVEPSHTYASAGAYEVCLEITNACGQSSSCRTINVFVLTECRIIDSLRLVTFYNATNGPEWTESWDLESTMDSWIGLVFFEDGCLAELNLPGNNLSGYIPEELGYLSRIVKIDLSDNFIGDTIPRALNFLSNLAHLNLSSNELSGRYYNELTELVSLVTLELQNNQLEGPLPTSLERMRNLRLLNLSRNKFEGTIPSSITQLTDLRVLDLSHNSLSGNMPIQIGNWEKIEAIYLQNNELSGRIPNAISSLDSLKAFWISHNHFHAISSLSPTQNWKDEAGLGIRLDNNRFTFEDLLPNMDLLSSMEHKLYAPQAKVFRDTILMVRPGEDVWLDIEVDNSLSDVQYDWYISTDLKFSFDNSVFEIKAVSENDAGQYVGKLSHPLVPDLVLETYPIRIEVDIESSIRDLNEFISVNMHPNPVGSQSQIRLDLQSTIPGNIQINMLDMSGRMVHTSERMAIVPGLQNLILQAPNAPGVYFIHIKDTDGKFSRPLKLIVY